MVSVGKTDFPKMENPSFLDAENYVGKWDYFLKKGGKRGKIKRRRVIDLKEGLL